MKLSLRLTYDTDAEKVRKMIKRLGQELLADDELGPKFLQPVKSQGVIEMEDSAMIMRVKFMTRPGDQWVARRVVFNRIRELFEKNGIRFASREVVVRVEGDRASSSVAAGAAADGCRREEGRQRWIAGSLEPWPTPEPGGVTAEGVTTCIWQW